MKVELSITFSKNFKKLVSGRPPLAIVVLEKVLLLTQDINHPSLRIHKLKGELKDVWSISIEKDLRIILDRKDPTKIILVDIGPHDKVY